MVTKRFIFVAPVPVFILLFLGTLAHSADSLIVNHFARIMLGSDRSYLRHKGDHIRFSEHQGSLRSGYVLTVGRSTRVLGLRSTVHGPLLLVHLQSAEVLFPTDATRSEALRANQQNRKHSGVAELIRAQHLSPWLLFTGAFFAMGFGGLDALGPFLGKRTGAAHLIRSRKNVRHAALLGIIVSLVRTAGVLALGTMALYASRYIVPELRTWGGVLFGILVAVWGTYTLLRLLIGTAADHFHLLGKETAFTTRRKTRSFQGVEAPREDRVRIPAKTAGLLKLLTLGDAGRPIFYPAALVVLLSTFALHRIALGFFLIVAFSLGQAGVLIGLGILRVDVRPSLWSVTRERLFFDRWLRIASSACIIGLGLILAFQGLAATHLSRGWFSKEKLGPVVFITGLGLLLGMRHSTDADHVVAISTIVSNQRSIRNAAFIGSVWGLGHTLMIFAVGALIILAGVKVPPRLGLSMEFSVALMLILLGVLNLTGITQKLSQRYSKPLAVPELDLNAKLYPATPATSELRSSFRRLGGYQFARPLLIGLVHGLAGSAAVALLVLSTIHNPIWATIYLLIFGLGTVIGMMCMTTAIAVPLTFAGDRFRHLGRYFGLTSGIISICFGLFLVYQLGFVNGLFTSHPQWTPR